MSHTVGFGPGGALEDRKKKEEEKRREEEVKKERDLSRPDKEPYAVILPPKRTMPYAFRDIDPTMERLDIEYFQPPIPGPTPGWVEGIQMGYFQYETAMARPSQTLREKATGILSEAEEAKLRGEDVRAGLLFSEYMLTRTGAGVWEGLTMPIRPMAMIGSLTQLSKLLTSHKGIPEAIEYVKTDPGVIGEFAGGFLGGSLLVDITRITGLARPKGYKLEEKTVPITEVETPATLMPKGKWPKGWGGTAVTILKERPEYASIWEPTKIYGPSTLPYIMGGITVMRITPSPKITQDLETEIKIEPVQEQAQILKSITYTRRKIRDPTLPLVEPKPIEREEEIISTLPGYVERPIIDVDTVSRAVPRVVQEAKPIQIQTQRIIQIPSVPTISTPRFERLTREIAVTRPPIKRKKVKKEPWDILTVGEFREYRVKMPKELLKGLG